MTTPHAIRAVAEATLAWAEDEPVLSTTSTFPLAAGLVPLGAAAFAVLVLWARRRVRDTDVTWLAGSRNVNPAERRVYAAHLSRHRTARLAGGVLGVLTAVVVGLWANDLSVSVGTDPTRVPVADVLFGGVSGVLVGTLAAECHRLRRTAGPVAAFLAPRRPAPTSRTVLAGRALAAAVLVLGVVSTVVTSDPAILTVTLVLLVPLALAERVRRAVLSRPRPVMSSQAARVDARLRLFAERVAARLGLAAALVALAWTTALSPAGGTVAPAASLVVVTVAPGALLSAIITLSFAAPRPRWGLPLRPGDEPCGPVRTPADAPPTQAVAATDDPASAPA